MDAIDAWMHDWKFLTLMVSGVFTLGGGVTAHILAQANLGRKVEGFDGRLRDSSEAVSLQITELSADIKSLDSYVRNGVSSAISSHTTQIGVIGEKFKSVNDKLDRVRCLNEPIRPPECPHDDRD